MTDPRAVRVALAPGRAGSALEPLILAPDAAPDGRVGARAKPGAGRRAAGRPSLAWLDHERAVLVRPGAPPERILLLPAAPQDGLGVVSREVVVGGWRIEVELESAVRAALRDRARRGREEAAHSGPTEVRAIIPGVVVSVSVAAGDEVVAGQQLLAVEAMKMQNELRAPRDGAIGRVAVSPGARIEVGDLLLVIT